MSDPRKLPEATLEEWEQARKLPHDEFVQFVETHSLAAIWDKLDKTDLSILPAPRRRE